MTGHASDAAIKHAFDCPCQDCEPYEEWQITFEHVDPQDPMIAGPRWRDALSEILTICEDANRPWQRLDVAAAARRALGEKA